MVSEEHCVGSYVQYKLRLSRAVKLTEALLSSWECGPSSMNIMILSNELLICDSVIVSTATYAVASQCASSYQ